MKQQRKRTNWWVVAGCLLMSACINENKPVTVTKDETAPAIAIPAVIAWDIVTEYPHDPAAFTEGLEYRDGFLYESIGQYGKSDVRKVDLKTGKILLQTKMDAKYFGEGLTVLNGKIYQLTYREGKGFIYDQTSLKPTGAFSFNAAEGWGMTNNGTSLIFDDGSNIFHFIDPATFKEIKRLAVTDEHGAVNELNEPELVNGFIYANQWRTELILKIDTLTGRVVGRADLSGLRQRAGIGAMSNNPHGPDVLNGIAWDAKNNRLFVTGKNWPKLLEIKLAD